MGGEEPTYRYEPYHHMTPDLKEFIDAVVEEKIKLANRKAQLELFSNKGFGTIVHLARARVEWMADYNKEMVAENYHKYHRLHDFLQKSLSPQL